MPTLLQPHRLVVELGSINYLIRSRVERTIRAIQPHSSGSISPAVVINASYDNITADIIESTIKRFASVDDVFTDHFARHGYVIVQGTSEVSEHGSIHGGLSYSLSERSVQVLLAKGAHPEGPYFARGQNLHQAWRLYKDDLAAFVTAVIPEDSLDAAEPRFEEYAQAGFTDAALTVPVPSRLYYVKTAQSPLAGLRVAIKDNMHLSGTATRLGNKAYAELYGTRNTTSLLVHKLIAQGAVVVGKTKLSAFAGSEVPPNQCIDYLPPWNPRGDGYQGPSGSSSGAGASAAGYDWVDVALCTDTGGSVRHPASSHGVWGLRNTWADLSMQGIVPATPLHDAVGILVRDPAFLEDVITAASKAARLDSNDDQQRMNELFLAALETSLGLKHTKISLKEAWSRTAPPEAAGVDLDVYFGTHASNLGAYDVYHVFDAFREEYSAQFGKKPYVSPSHTARWDHGATITSDQYEEAVRVSNVVKKWFENVIWKAEGSHGPPILVLPQGRPRANYRDTIAPSPNAHPNDYNTIMFTCIIGCPHLVVPVGQNPYESRVSGNTEHAPIFSSIIGPPNSDAMLVKVARNALKNANWPTNILTGRYMFKTADNERNTEDVAKGRLL